MSRHQATMAVERFKPMGRIGIVQELVTEAVIVFGLFVLLLGGLGLMVLLGVLLLNLMGG